MRTPTPRVERARAFAVLGASVLLLLAACDRSVAPRAAGRSAGATPVPSAPAVPLAGAVRPSLLIDQAEPFTVREVQRLREVSGVTRLALIGYRQVWVYDRQIPTATVDPLTYRPFTPAGTKDSAAVWDAIAEGKAMISHAVGMRDRLPLDATVPAGSATVWIGGLATTVPGVDMVVSSETGERIGVPYGNGLVVAISGGRVPTMARIRRILGPAPTVRQIAKDPGPLGSMRPGGPHLPPITPSGAPGKPAVPGATSVSTPSPVATRRARQG